MFSKGYLVGFIRHVFLLIRPWRSTYDIILDATDNVATRYLLNDASVLAGKPLVSGSALRFEGQVSEGQGYVKSEYIMCVTPICTMGDICVHLWQ